MLASAGSAGCGTVSGVYLLDTPMAVHHRLMRLDNAAPAVYLDVAFTDLSGYDYPLDQIPSTPQIAQIARVLSQRVPLVDVFVAYVEHCWIRGEDLPLAEVFTNKLVEQRMTLDPIATLQSVIDARPRLSRVDVNNVLNLVGACSPASALHTLLAVPLTSELSPEQFDALFAQNEQIQEEGAYRVNRPYYLRQLVFRAMPGDVSTDARAMALLLSREWHGNFESLLATSTELTPVPQIP